MSRSNCIKTAKENVAAARAYRTGVVPPGVHVYEAVPGSAFALAMWEACMKNARSARRIAQHIYGK